MEYQKKRNVEIMEEFEHELKKQESDFDTRQRNEDRRDKIRKLEGEKHSEDAKIKNMKEKNLKELRTSFEASKAIIQKGEDGQ